MTSTPPASEPRAHRQETDAAPFEIVPASFPTVPVVVASPHSGRRYTESFLRQTRLSRMALRRSEDAYVDTLFAAAPACGASLLKALFPRTFVDVNREPLELDPGMFSDPLPWRVNRKSPRVRGGLGVIARIGASGVPIYDLALPASEARDRLRGCYFPYHRALRDLVRATSDRFGYAILLDCHSMPSQAASRASVVSRARGGVDFVLGDCHGASCMPELTDRAESALSDLGYTVARNSPYAGGFTTRHYGRRGAGAHALQIEVNRALYMDEVRLCLNDGAARLRRDLSHLVEALGAVTPFARAAE